MQVRLHGRSRSVRTVAYDSRHNTVVLVDQRLLPHRFSYFRAVHFRATAAAIRDMVVRGAGAIGATAALGLAQGVRAFPGANLARFRQHAERVFRELQAARPTAVDPVNAMNQVRAAMSPEHPVEQQQEAALTAALEFVDASVAQCRAIGGHGAPLIRAGMRVLTHCNAGWLAFVDVGSATAPLYEAQRQQLPFRVYCDETRPRCQGASLTAWELAHQGIPHEIIADNAAGYLMQRGEIDLVLVGSDRVLGRTGEVANKIGTYTKAVLARRHGIPFYVAIPLSTIDWCLKAGTEIPIEERAQDEVLGAWGVDRRGTRRWVRIANPTSSARNPGFDVTPADLVTGIITPQGIYRPTELWRRRQELGYAG
jgi:methylthioribose-1-phosphate isomerase